MDFDQDIADMRVRIAKAESVRDLWKKSGRREKYYETYFMVNALQVQLSRLRRQRLDCIVRRERGVHLPEILDASRDRNTRPSLRASLS
jgi:hypothetical protein